MRPWRELSRSRNAGHVVRGGLALCVVGSALGLGGANVSVALAVCSVLGLVAGVAVVFRQLRAFPAPSWVMAGLAAYSLLQAVPLPITVLGALSPQAADVWARALYPFGESVAWGSLSLDPGASLVEGAKWAAYAVAFALASELGRGRGSNWGLTLVFVSAFSVALATLGHGLFDATHVFGLYEPSFGVSRWHIGPFLNPNNLAGYLNLGVFIGLGKAVSGRERARWFWALGTAFLAACSFLSGSRGGAVSLILGLSLFILLLTRVGRGQGPNLARWLPLALALCVALLFGVLGARDSTLGELFTTDVKKLYLSQSILPMIRDHAWFGVGRGAFESAFPHYAVVQGNRIYAHAENWVVQWFAEWGVVVTGLAIAALVALFRPARIDAFRSPLRLSALLAVATWLLQNLVDLGTELIGPSLAVVVLLGSCWTAPRNAKQQGGQAREGALWRLGGPVFGAGLLTLSCIFGWTQGRSSVSAERSDFQKDYLALSAPAKAEDLRALLTRLRGAMLRHPAEPYFPRLGALVALRLSPQAPMAWVQRTLERCSANGRTHWILAHALVRRNALHQALLEARLAVEYDPSLARQVGASVAHWTSSPKDLERAAPAGRNGGVLLEAACQVLRTKSLIDEADECLRLALRRDENFSPARVALTGSLLQRLRRSRDVNGPLPQEIEQHAQRLRELQPASAQSVGFLAELALLTGRARQVKPQVRAHCSQLQEEEKVRCLRVLLKLLSSDELDRAELREVARELRGFAEASDAWKLSENLGDILAKARLWEDALHAYQHSATGEPRPELLLKLAECAIHAGQFALANRAFERAFRSAQGGLRQKVAARRDILLRSMIR